jgi:hypothetical protein
MSDVLPPDAAVPVILTPLGQNDSIDLPDAHVSTSAPNDQEILSIENAAMQPADSLNAAIGATTGDGYGSGTITSLAPGAIDDTSIAVGLDNTSAGAQSGTVTMDFASDGSVSGVNGAYPETQDMTLTGNVYRLAAASITVPDVILHVGDGSGSVTELLTVTNTDPADGYSESLLATALGGAGGDVTGASGTTGDIAAGSSDSSSLSVTISTAAASAGGTVAVGETSDGTGIDTLGTTALGTIDVPVNIAVDNYANPTIQQVGGSATLSQVGDTYTLNFGTVYQGYDVIDSLDVANDVTGPADWLSGTLSASGDAAFSDTGLGAFGPLSAGDTTPVSIDFNPQGPGVFTQTITVAETDSNASGFNEVLSGQTIVVTGTAYGPATPSISAAPVYVHRGDDGGSVAIPITISNTAPANGYAENLDARIVNFGTYVTAASGSVIDLAPGNSNDTAMSATIGDASVGTYSGEVEVALQSDGTGIDSHGTTSLGNAYVQATLVVDNYAKPVVQQVGGTATLSQVGDTYTLDFGTVSAGQGQLVDTLNVANAVSGPADWLSGILSASGDAAFSDTGLGAYGPLSAGGTAPLAIDLNTADSGTFNQTITLSATDSNPSGYDAALSGLTIEVTGTVVPCFCRDTLILTDCGEVPVQDLLIGDKIATAAGMARRIKWIGRRSYSGRFVMGRKDILPICIKAGALGDNVPARDLWISPHHAMYFKDNDIDGVLIEAKDLVNGVSIVQAERVEKLEYFHVELDTHDVIIAEGAPSESFIDDDSRGMFHNAHEYDTLYADEIGRPARYCAPRLGEGYEVEAVRRRIAQCGGLLCAADGTRVGALRGFVDLVNATCIAGWAQNVDHPEAPVCLDIYAGGNLIGQALANRYRDDLRRAGLGSGRHSFAFTPPPELEFDADMVQVRRSLDGTALEFSADPKPASRLVAVASKESSRRRAVTS